MIPCPLCHLDGFHRLAALALGCPMCHGLRWLRFLSADRGPVGRFPHYPRRPS